MSPFSVNPEPSVHLAPNCKPTTCSPDRPAPPPQFHRISDGQRPRPTSSTPHASPPTPPTVHRRSPTTSSPVAGRAWCFDVKLNRSSFHGITTLSDSCPGGSATRTSSWPARPFGSVHRPVSLVP